MTTAAKLIQNSLELLNVASNIAPADPEQTKKGFDELVGLIAELNFSGQLLGIEPPRNVAEEINEPPWSTRILDALLADRLIPFFQIEPKFELRERIRSARVDLALYTIPRVKPSPPETLPLGSGNKQSINRTYFKKPDDSSIT